ncbi:glucose-1-phosphate cytidylyltransferase [Mariprofundus ferrinatatus]|uniref:Glucose-1-phosphate cytidylyltransferase n=2 Tax=Mariprofundus ferrinatatus TaxID=1921087 RepID=A0A2K8L6S4_9PROT|nr:glucose-1-phosphate cytidylyltransferase [Mariprofundus ferrinatatus]
MVDVGSKPILWHIMKSYSAYGINDFIICLGYKGYLIKEYFANYFLHMSDVTFDMQNNSMQVHQNMAEPWRVTLVDTGENTQTGGRMRRVADHLKPDQPFCFTYGDGLCDVDIRKLIDFHNAQGLLATVTAVQPPGRFGSLEISGDRINHFNEKPKGDGGWINGGYFVLSPEVLKLIKGDATVWEKEPLQRLSEQGQLSAYRHAGFWQPMDTLRDKVRLEGLWESGEAPWMVW